MVVESGNYQAGGVNIRLEIPEGDDYKSQAERSFAQFGPALLLDRFGVAVYRLDYEPFTLNMAGNRYTPDFCAILSSGAVVFVEVKSSKSQRGYRDARSKLRQAAALHPEYCWCECMVTFRRGVPVMELEVIDA